MRFLARFASAADLECFRIDELRAVCSLLGITGWRIEGLASADDCNEAATRDADPATLIDALVIKQGAAESSLAKAQSLSQEQPLGNHKNFYGTASASPVSTNEEKNATTDAEKGMTSIKEANKPKQPLNFAIVHFETVNDAVRVASRCVMLKGMSLLFAMAEDVDRLIAKVQQLIVDEAGMQAADASEKNVFTSPVDKLNTAASSSSSAVPKVSGKPITVLANKDTNEALLTPLLSDDSVFKYLVEAVCWTVQSPEKLAIIQQFAAIPHKGKINLSCPDITFEVVMLYEHINNPQRDVNVPQLLGAAFCVPVAVSSRTYILERYALNRRPYIGTTSMPPELTFLMANLAKVKSGDICYDPFCGTCSSLITCAHHGAIAYGSDIDGQAMRGGSVKFQQSKQILHQQKQAMKHYLPACLKANGGPIDEAEAAHPSVHTNFKLYGLQQPERLRYDFSLWVTMFDQEDSAFATAAAASSSPKTDEEGSISSCCVGVKRPRDVTKPFLFDAIMSDPPYGVREQKLQTTSNTAAGGSAEATSSTATAGDATSAAGDGTSSGASHHTPSPAAATAREDYDISTMIVDLIRFAGVHLGIGKRIVFWHPTTYQYTPEELPRHPYLRIVLARPQMLSLKLVRVLVVMERVAEPWFPLPEGVKGPKDVTKAILFPNQRTASLRQLMDTTELDDNLAYAQYRERRDQKREAVRSYWGKQQNQKGDAEEGEGGNAEADNNASKAANPTGGVSKRQLSKQKALLNVENRERKLKAAEEARVANDAKQQQQQQQE